VHLLYLISSSVKGDLFKRKKRIVWLAMTDYIETTDDLLRRVIQPRHLDSHKGDNGVVSVVGGSRIFHGAPFFASMSALRAGADLVYLAVPKLIAPSIRSLTPDLIVFPVADAKLTRGAADAFLKWLPEIDCLVLGPGLGRQNLDGARKIISQIALERKVRVSLDAEAQNTEMYHLLKGKDCVTTPHPGEFKRIFGLDPGQTTEERIVSVKAKAKEFGITIVLKAHNSIISDGDTVYVNSTGGAAMTCGGIGDTLSGVIGALCAQAVGSDLKAVDIAGAASYAVGRAGERAEATRGFHIVASDIIQEIPFALKPFDRQI
jgi:ADP-dependent NAD(P)H-hydrate dehydratase